MVTSRRHAAGQALLMGSVVIEYAIYSQLALAVAAHLFFERDTAVLALHQRSAQTRPLALTALSRFDHASVGRARLLWSDPPALRTPHHFFSVRRRPFDSVLRLCSFGPRQ